MNQRGGSLAPFGALSFAYFASIGLFNPYAPLWFQSLGFSTLAIGAIGSLQAWTRVVAPYAWSWTGDHWEQGSRRTTLLRIATVLALVFAAGLLWTRSYGGVSVIVATRNGECVADVVRGCGCRVSRDRRRITVLV